MTKDPTAIRSALTAALAHLRTFGWVKGKSGSKNGPCCATGAMTAVIGEKDQELWNASRAAVGEAAGRSDVESWNDASERQFGDVEQAFEKAIKRHA